MAGPWERYAQPAPPVGDPVIAPPDPYKQQSAEIAISGEERSARRESRDIAETGFDQAAKLRNDFMSLPVVKEYQTVIRQYGTALQTAPTPSGDQALIVAYAKMLDPGSVVREGEFDVTAQADSLLGRTVSRIYRELGLPEGGRLSDEARTKVRREIHNLARNFNRSYNQARQQYRGLAETYGFDPELVIGPHFGEPYQDTIRQFWSGEGSGQEAGTIPAARIDETAAPIPGVIDPTQQQIYADGVRWGDDMGDGRAFNRDEYLADQFGIEPGDEAKIAAFWNANRGNEGLTPDGVRQWYQRNNLPAPRDADIVSAIGQARQPGVTFGGLDTQAGEQSYNNQLDAVLQQRGADPESLSGAVGINAAQGATLGSLDEIAGAGGFVGALARGQDPVAAYQVERDVLRREQERAQDARPGVSIGSEIGGSLLTGGVGFGNAARAGRLAQQARAAGNTARAASLNRQAITGAAGAGTVTGGIYGFNTGEGLGGSSANALVGAAGGTALGAGAQAAAPYISRGVNALADAIPRRAPAATPEQMGILEAGQRVGVPVRAPDVRPELRVQRGVARSSERGNRILRDAESEDIAAAERAVSGLSTGRAAEDTFQAGERAQTVLTRADKRRYTGAQRFYKIAEDASNGQTFRPQGAVDTLDSEIARLQGEGADASIINFLTGERDKLARPEGWTPMQLHAKRSSLRKDIRAAGLPADAADLPMIRALDAASQDLKGALANNPKALRAMERGDQLWRERAELRQEVTDKLLGRRGEFTPDQTGRALASMTRADTQRLSRFVDEMTPEERADFASTVAAQLGRDNKGNFSFSQFLSQTEGKQAAATPRTLRLLFGEDGMRAIKDLRAISQAKVDAASETNVSKTGNIVQRVAKGFRAFLFGSVGLAEAGLTGSAVGVGAGTFLSRLGEKRTARLMTNPDFTRWLRTAPNTTNPRAIDRHFARLEAAAARVPGMSSDVEAFKQALIAAANDNAAVTTSVAQEQDAQER